MARGKTARDGFGVGLWNWPEWDIVALEKTGAHFTIMNGYLEGRLADDEGAEMLLKSARETAQIGKRLGVDRLNLRGTGLGDGDLIRRCEKCLPWIGEIQVANTPGRCEPGTGEINYSGVANAVSKLGYSGPVGMEAFAQGNEVAALEAFRAAFTL